MRTGLAVVFALLMMIGGNGSAQDLPQRGEVAFGRQPLIRGTVTATAADHLTIKTDAGETYSIAITPNTRLVREDRGLPGGGRSQAGDGTRQQPRTIKVDEVKVGDGAGAMGEVDAPNKTIHALFVAVMDAEQVKRLREGLGKEYITGKISAIDEVKLTILRPDNVSQVIEVDETTSFRRGGRRGARLDGSSGTPSSQSGAPSAPVAGGAGGESITLADVKVDDMIVGQGSVKHGVFVPTNLTVLPPGGMNPRMRREGAPPSPQPNAPPQQ